MSVAWGEPICVNVAMTTQGHITHFSSFSPQLQDRKHTVAKKYLCLVILDTYKIQIHRL